VFVCLYLRFPPCLFVFTYGFHRVLFCFTYGFHRACLTSLNDFPGALSFGRGAFAVWEPLTKPSQTQAVKASGTVGFPTYTERALFAKPGADSSWLKSSVLNNLRLSGFCSLFGFEPNRHGGGVFERPTICHLNYCSIFVCISSLKFAVLDTVSYIYEFDIICVTETWIKSSVLNNLCLPDFCSLFGFEPNRHGGGVFGLRSM